MQNSWLLTRDSSPTLWNNQLAEPYRSLKGAFTESWHAFVWPSLNHCLNKNLSDLKILEFGLGPGTNWLLFSTACQYLKIKTEYIAIERDSEVYNQGCQKWQADFSKVNDFVAQKLEQKTMTLSFGDLSEANIIFSIDDFCAKKYLKYFDLYYHDPFGFEVNPDGYSLELLSEIKKSWKDDALGCSYSCNKSFFDLLRRLKCDFHRLDTSKWGLKKHSAIFSPSPISDFLKNAADSTS